MSILQKKGGNIHNLAESNQINYVTRFASYQNALQVPILHLCIFNPFQHIKKNSVDCPPPTTLTTQKCTTTLIISKLNKR